MLDDRSLLIPDAKCNNKLDSLINIIEAGQVGYLFLIPDVDETLRLNCSAIVSSDNTLLAYFSDEKVRPKSVVKVEVSEMFFHCTKVFVRSNLRNTASRVERSFFPSLDAMIDEQLELA